MQIIYNGRDHTPKPLTENDLTEIEEHYTEDDKAKIDSLWDTLIAAVEEKNFQSFEDEKIEDSSTFAEIPDLDDITNEVLY